MKPRQFSEGELRTTHAEPVGSRQPLREAARLVCGLFAGNTKLVIVPTEAPLQVQLLTSEHLDVIGRHGFDMEHPDVLKVLDAMYTRAQIIDSLS